MVQVSLAKGCCTTCVFVSGIPLFLLASLFLGPLEIFPLKWEICAVYVMFYGLLPWRDEKEIDRDLVKREREFWVRDL